MLDKINSNIPITSPLLQKRVVSSKPVPTATNPITKTQNLPNYSAPIALKTSLTTQEDKKKYEFLLNFMKNYPVSQNSNGKSIGQQLEFLLKSGKLFITFSSFTKSNLKSETSILFCIIQKFFPCSFKK